MSGNGVPAGEATTDDMRMDLYELFHRRAEAERRWQLWRLAGGHAVVAGILAYAVAFDSARFVALTPILYGVVVMDGLRTSVRRLYIQQRLVELEAKLAEREPLADWVTRYGQFGDGTRVTVADVDLNTVPETAQYALILSIYLGLIAASLLAWRPVDAAAATVPPVTRSLLLLGYATFSLLFGAIVVVGYLHYRRVRDRIAEVARATRPVP